MGVETVSLIIAAFVNGSLGIAALMRNFRSRLCVSFALLAGVLFAHDSLSVLETFAAGGSWASPRWHSFTILLAGPASLWLLRRLVPMYKRQLKPVVWGYLGLVTLCTPIYFLKVYDRIYLLLGVFSHVLFIVPAAIWMFTLAGIGKDSQLTRERLRLRYAFWGGTFTIAFFVTDALRFTGIPVPPLGTLARTLYLIFLFQTFIQKELMTSEELVGKISLFGGIALMLSSIYALLVSWVGDQPDLFFFNTLIASFVIIILFDPIRNLSTRLTRKLFLRRNAMLEDALHRLSEELLGTIEPSELSRKIGLAMRKAFSVDRWALYLAEKDGLSYVQVENTRGFAEIPSSNPLVEYITLRNGRPFVLESIENDRDSFYSSQPRKFCQACLDAMRNVGADCVIPFMHESRLVGFFAVKMGERVALSNEQLRLFIPLSRQVAFLLRNAQTFSYLRDRDKLAAVGEMAAGLAHEIKNPLGAIKGAAELLSEEVRDSEFLKIIVDETNRLSGVLSDFLDYAKPRRVELQQSCDVVRVLDHTAAMILRDRKISVEIASEKEGITLEADPEILKQVFLNLFLNAVQAMDGFTDKPRLKVTVKEIRPRRLFPFADSLPKYKVWEGWKPPGISSPRPYVAVEIEDNGIGISREDMARIFVPFYTTKPKGTGLGLAICQRLIEGMGGTIHVKANEPDGSVFVIHLPIKRDEMTQEKRYETSENISRR